MGIIKDKLKALSRPLMGASVLGAGIAMAEMPQHPSDQPSTYSQTTEKTDNTLFGIEMAPADGLKFVTDQDVEDVLSSEKYLSDNVIASDTNYYTGDRVDDAKNPEAQSDFKKRIICGGVDYVPGNSNCCILSGQWLLNSEKTKSGAQAEQYNSPIIMGKYGC